MKTQANLDGEELLWDILPSIWEQVKSDLQINSTQITLDYFGVFRGEPLIFTLTKFRLGTTFQVSVTLGERDYSVDMLNFLNMNAAIKTYEDNQTNIS